MLHRLLYYDLDAVGWLHDELTIPQYLELRKNVLNNIIEYDFFTLLKVVVQLQYTGEAGKLITSSLVSKFNFLKMLCIENH